MVKIIHSGNAGDLIYSLPAMRKAAEIQGEKVHLYLRINVPGQYAGMNHPLGNVQMNQTIAEMLTPLLMATDFIGNCEITEQPQEVHYNFDLFRKIHNYTGHISQWYFHVYPELTCDLSIPVDFNLNPGNIAFDIVLNRTSRYHNHTFDYSILKPYQERITFVGLPQEFKVISAKLPNIKHYEVDNFYELAQAIQGSQLFIGNQSMAFAIAEQMKHPRILEICPTAHNVIPTGANGYGAWTILNLLQIIKNG
jgi:ADP-heptose:LPS heptosyltransferase